MRSAVRVLVVVTLTALVVSSASAQRRGGFRGQPLGQGLLRNQAQGMCLDIAGYAARGDGNVLLWRCNGDPDQVWSFSRNGELTSALDGRCLDAAGYDGARGANVGVYLCEGRPDQQWTMVPRGRGVFELRNAQQGMCLDVNGRRGAEGDNVLLWHCDGGRDQLWTFEPVPVRRPPVVTQPPPPAYPPPPPPVYAPMDQASFQALLDAVGNEAFSKNKLDVIEHAASAANFSVAQVKSIIEALSFSADKLRALELTATRIVDRQNAFQIYASFTFSSDKARAKEILQRAGY